MPVKKAAVWAARALFFGAGSYAVYAIAAWLRYGHPTEPNSEEADPLLDRFIPKYEVAERHHIRVRAPAPVTFAAACDQDLMGLPMVRAIFKAREVILGAEPGAVEHRSLLAQMTSIGWVVLAEQPGREIVMGAVTQPWSANVVFRPLPPEQFAAFSDPDFVKIVWTLRADPVGANESVFRTETRVAATDASARTKFRGYWAKFSAGIILIRWLLLPPVRREAERRVHRSPS